MEQRRRRSIGSGMQKWLMRKVSWFLSSASYQASQKPMESQQVIRTLWTFVDIRSPHDCQKTQVEAVPTSPEPLPLHLRIGLYALKHSVLASRASADACHDFVISVSPVPLDRRSDNSSVISDSMRQKPKGIAFPESTQPIKIQEEGIPLWPNKGVLNALPQEPSFGRFFTGFDPTSLPSPCRPSYLYCLFEAFRPNRRPSNPPLQTVSHHRRARLRQLLQPNPSTRRFLCHGSPTAPRS